MVSQTEYKNYIPPTWDYINYLSGVGGWSVGRSAVSLRFHLPFPTTSDGPRYECKYGMGVLYVNM